MVSSSGGGDGVEVPHVDSPKYVRKGLDRPTTHTSTDQNISLRKLSREQGVVSARLF